MRNLIIEKCEIQDDTYEIYRDRNCKSYDECPYSVFVNGQILQVFETMLRAKRFLTSLAKLNNAEIKNRVRLNC